MAEEIAELKRAAAEKAAEFVQTGMIVGLGTGSTAVHATRAIGRMLKRGQLRDIIAIPTSNATATEAGKLAIPLSTLDKNPVIDLTIDGADEIDPNLNLIKGLGGALLREKVVASASKRVIIVADHRKQVTLLGTRAPVPVEVIPFARAPVKAFLESLGAQVTERTNGGGLFVTDEQNLILDAFFDGILDPASLARTIRTQPGVVEHGLFLDLATEAIIASLKGIKLLQRS
jgi:ribose 5-phosphate isomerase A